MSAPTTNALGAEPPHAATLNLASPGAMSTPAAAVGLCMFGAVFAISLGWHLTARSRALRQAREADASWRQASQELFPGERVLVGRVELAQGATTAARVEIDQEGAESESSGSWSFTWTETRRRVTMLPFYVRLDGGERVRVEPGDRAFLVDALDGMTVIDNLRRTRHAELTPGERVCVAGVLRRGMDPESARQAYRGGSDTGWIVVPPPGGDMLLSSEPLDERFLRTASGRSKAAWIVAAALACELYVAAPSLIRFALAENTVGEVIERRDDSDSDSSSYSVRVQVRGTAIWIPADATSYDLAEKGRRAHVTFVEAFPDASRLGLHAYGAADMVIFPAIAMIAMFIGGWWVMERGKRWYEKRVTDRGAGKLAENVQSTSMHE